MACFSMEYDLHYLFFSRIRLVSFVFEQNINCMICFSAEYDLYHLFSLGYDLHDLIFNRS